ncbi:transposase [Acetobacter malorum]|uniref:Transposase n=1 Tax=Acetobacter malorum TaxID=178901 RepID=A0A177G573_9PROT|nr:transposase [Acetobacter malorum]OAG75490.1 transposase [Acetobacter malorum]
MKATEAAAITGLAPMTHDSGAMRGKRIIPGEKRSLCHVLFQAGLAAACYNPVLKTVATHTKERGKPHKLVIVTIANAILKTGVPWRISSTA